MEDSQMNNSVCSSSMRRRGLHPQIVSFLSCGYDGTLLSLSNRNKHVMCYIDEEQWVKTERFTRQLHTTLRLSLDPCCPTLTLMWWHGSAPVRPCPRSGPSLFCRPLGCCVWQTPLQWCSCSPGWTHCGWSGTAGYSSPRLSLQWGRLKNNIWHRRLEKCPVSFHREKLVKVEEKQQQQQQALKTIWASTTTTRPDMMGKKQLI